MRVLVSRATISFGALAEYSRCLILGRGALGFPGMMTAAAAKPWRKEVEKWRLFP